MSIYKTNILIEQQIIWIGKFQNLKSPFPFPKKEL